MRSTECPVVLVLPGQEAALDTVGGGGGAGVSGQVPEEAGAVAIGERAGTQLAMYTGVFNLLWATVTILMIIRPGSTTGA